MKQLIILFLLLITTTAMANITPTTIPTFTLYGGEDKNINLTIENDFSYDINADLLATLTNESGDYEGINVYILPSEYFEIKAYQKQDIIVVVQTVPNILPEAYQLNLVANYYLGEEQTPIRTERIGSGGGGRNTITYIDKNVIVEVPKEIVIEKITKKEVIKEVPKEVIKEVEKEVSVIVTDPFFIITSAVLLGIILLLILFVMSKNKPNGGN